MELQIKLLNEDATLPTKAHDTDSGFDLYASDELTIKPGETAIVPTGVAVKFPELWGGMIRPRSGMTAKTKLRVQTGTIDNDYTGEIGIIVDNIGQDEIKIDKGLKLAQMVLEHIPLVDVKVVDELEHGVRGEKGYGSTGERWKIL